MATTAPSTSTETKIAARWVCKDPPSYIVTPTPVRASKTPATAAGCWCLKASTTPSAATTYQMRLMVPSDRISVLTVSLPGSNATVREKNMEAQ